MPLFSCHNLLGFSALPQPEIYDTHLEVLYHFGFEDLRGSLNSGILWKVKSSSAFVFHVGKLSFGFCSQVIISILYLILLTLLSSSLGDFTPASSLRTQFPPPTDFAVLLVFYYRYHYLLLDQLLTLITTSCLGP